MLTHNHTHTHTRRLDRAERGGIRGQCDADIESVRQGCRLRNCDSESSRSSRVERTGTVDGMMKGSPQRCWRSMLWCSALQADRGIEAELMKRRQTWVVEAVLERKGRERRWKGTWMVDVPLHWLGSGSSGFSPKSTVQVMVCHGRCGAVRVRILRSALPCSVLCALCSVLRCLPVLLHPQPHPAPWACPGSLAAPLALQRPCSGQRRACLHHALQARVRLQYFFVDCPLRQRFMWVGTSGTPAHASRSQPELGAQARVP